MPLLPFDEVLSPDKLVEGKVKLNTTLELVRLFVNALESYVNGLTPEQISGLIVGGKINPTYLDAFLTSVAATDVTFSSLEAGFTSEDVASALDYLYNAVSNITVPSGFPATSISIVDTDGYYTGTEVETALKEVYEAVASAGGGGSPYIVDDGRTSGFTASTIDATSTGAVSIGSASTVLDSDGSVILGESNSTNGTYNSIIAGLGIASDALFATAAFGAWSSLENVDNSFFFGDNSYFGAPIPGQSSYNSIVMGSDSSATSIYQSVILGSNNGSTLVDGVVVIGPRNNISNNAGSVIIGSDTDIISTVPGDSDESIAVGSAAYVGDSYSSIAIGRGSAVTASDSSVSIGDFASAQDSVNSIVVGPNSRAQLSTGGIAIGSQALVTSSNYGITIGTEESITNSNYSVIVSADWGYSSIVGTVGNQNASIINSIFGGDSAVITTSDYSTVVGSASSEITNAYLGLIIGAESGVVNGANGYAGIIGGVWNEIVGVANNNYIFGGSSNEVNTGSFQAVILGGSYNTISGDAWFRSILGGEGNVIDGDVFEYNGISPSNQRSYSRRNHEFVIAGDQSASADFNRSGTPNFTYGGGKASTMHMYVKTSDATPTYLRADAMNHIPLLNRTATGFKVYLLASNFNAAANESAYWEITFATDVRNGVARLLGVPVVNELHKDVPSWDVVVDVETIAPVPVDPQAPFANARIQVTGEAAKNIVWSARVDISEIDF